MSARSLDTTAQQLLLAPRMQARMTATLITVVGACVCVYVCVSSRVSSGPNAQISGKKGMNKVSTGKKKVDVLTQTVMRPDEM